MNKLFLFLIIAFSQICEAQQIHVRYMKVLSSFATTHEDLYIKNNQALSIQDSIIIQNKLNDSWTTVVNLDNGKKPPKQYFVSDLTNDDEKNFFFTANVDNRDFFIYDNVLKPEWKIDETQTKMVAGYNCTKATSTFRGSKITAFFAKDLPYSTGPFKFYGLPGLILDIRVDNMDHEIWKAEFINIDDQTIITYKPKFLNKEKISLKDYVETKEAHMNKIFKKVSDALPSSNNINITNNQRFTVEQKYEWE
ncbi:GLPGLI family protein [Chryseobacterium sp. GP-SGM7]|uniref:GLPGLI family protein n=1 Tax=Chryseobacterium sp. GP-SGM7 TaxID=3411323 RepID=UPI003B93617D